MDGCDSDTSSVSQELDSLDSDILSVCQESDSCDDDTNSVGNDSEYSLTLDRMNIMNQSLLDETLGEESESESIDEQLSIPVHVSKNRISRELETRNRTITTVKNDPRIQASCYLPSIGVTNYRSLGPKVKNVIKDIMERQLSLILSSETWERTSNKKLKLELERMLELEGL